MGFVPQPILRAGGDKSQDGGVVGWVERSEAHQMVRWVKRSPLKVLRENPHCQGGKDGNPSGTD
ncbi:MAG: hypothetical protein A3J24_05450 [Deltaproteobacteria bacterium RIFCSPLOWO2_02_FULL_53_8]|nr:MAG: hypothetical protein A3J24_05450 [Deltaproteobacteria bacterium RIFCSPLOWO2_02_FULL_53_8]